MNHSLIFRLVFSLSLEYDRVLVDVLAMLVDHVVLVEVRVLLSQQLIDSRLERVDSFRLRKEQFLLF